MKTIRIFYCVKTHDINFPYGGDQEPSYEAKESCLSCRIRADDSCDYPLTNGGSDIIKCRSSQTGESFGDVDKLNGVFYDFLPTFLIYISIVIILVNKK